MVVTVSKDFVVFSICAGMFAMFSLVIHSLFSAFTNRSGPKVPAKGGRRLKNYSGLFETDMVNVFVNIITGLNYVGELLEEVNGRIGFFNQYRFASYLLTCPLTVWELGYACGAPYRVTLASLCLVALLCAFFADIAPQSEKWAWFAIGSVFYLTLAARMAVIARRSKQITEGIAKGKKSFDFEAAAGTGWSPRHKDRKAIGKTMMNEAQQYMNLAVGLLYTVWPMFPIMFVLEQAGVVSRDVTQVVYAVADILAKSLHSIFLERYKARIQQAIATFGFLRPDVLGDIDLDDDIMPQLLHLAGEESAALHGFGGSVKLKSAPIATTSSYHAVASPRHQSTLSSKSLLSITPGSSTAHSRRASHRGQPREDVVSCSDNERDQSRAISRQATLGYVASDIDLDNGIDLPGSVKECREIRDRDQRANISEQRKNSSSVHVHTADLVKKAALASQHQTGDTLLLRNGTVVATLRSLPSEAKEPSLSAITMGNFDQQVADVAAMNGHQILSNRDQPPCLTSPRDDAENETETSDV